MCFTVLFLFIVAQKTISKWSIIAKMCPNATKGDYSLIWKDVGEGKNMFKTYLCFKNVLNNKNRILKNLYNIIFSDLLAI